MTTAPGVAAKGHGLYPGCFRAADLYKRRFDCLPATSPIEPLQHKGLNQDDQRQCSHGGDTDKRD